MSATVHTLTPSDELVPLDDVGIDAVILEVDPPDADQGDGSSQPIPVEVVARERVAAAGTTAYDSEAGEWLPVTPAMAERERQMREAFALGRLMQAVVVREVFDGKLYLAAGCETREQYAEDVLGVGRHTAQNLYRTATRLAPYLPSADGLRQLSGGNGEPVHHEPGHDEMSAVIQGTPLSSLYELTKLGGDDLDALLDGSALQLADGRTVSIEDFRRASRREATLIVRELKAEFRGKIQRDQERADLAEAERDLYRERLEKTDGVIDTLRDGARLWGPRQLHAEGQIALMESIEQHLKAVGIAADQIHPDDDVPDAVARASASMLHRFETHLLNLRDRLAPLTARL